MAVQWRKYILWFAQEHVEFRKAVSIDVENAYVQYQIFL